MTHAHTAAASVVVAHVHYGYTNTRDKCEAAAAMRCDKAALSITHVNRVCVGCTRATVTLADMRGGEAGRAELLQQRARISFLIENGNSSNIIGSPNLSCLLTEAQNSTT